MADTFSVNLTRPIKSAAILDGFNSNAESPIIDGSGPAANGNQVQPAEYLRAQKQMFEDVCRTLQGLVVKLDEFYNQLFTEQKEEIARLSVEIARKILMQKVRDGDYEIESIVREAIKNAPAHQDLVVHLNPQDLADCQKVQADNESGDLAGIKLVADPNIGRAECLLESPKGIIKSLIEENLEQIAKALEKAE